MRHFVIPFFIVILLSGCSAFAPPMDDDGRGRAVAPDGTPIRYEVAGTGETTLLFIHGWSCDRTYWKAQIPHFAKSYRTVALDLAGHGASPMGRAFYSIEAFGEDVAAVVRRLDLYNVILVGHSMGGPVAAEAAVRLPNRVIGVVGVDTFETGEPLPQGAQRAAFIQAFKDDFPGTVKGMIPTMFSPESDPRLVDRITGDMASAPKEVGISAMEHFFDWHQGDAAMQSYPPRLTKRRPARPPAANDPFSHIHRYFTDEFSRFLTGIPEPAKPSGELEELPIRLVNINADPLRNKKPLSSRVILVKGAGHFIPQEKPKAFNRALERAIERIAGH